MFGFGLGSFFNFGIYIALFSAVCISLWVPLKKSITFPRIGQVEFSDSRQKKIDRAKLLSLVFFSITFFVGVAFFFVFATAKIGFLVEMRAMPVIVMMSFAIIAFLGIASLIEVKRFGIYATVTLIALLAAMSGRVDPMIALMETGAFTVVCGMFVFVRFLTKYPRLPGGDDQPLAE